MEPIVFIDTEIEPKSGKILDIGCIKDNGGSFHSNLTADFIRFVQGYSYICGHNIIYHDMKYLADAFSYADQNDMHVIDTLYLSPLLFPEKPYHALVKDDRLESDEINNPLNHAIMTKSLFYDEISNFVHLDHTLKQIYYQLLANIKEFRNFFRYIGYRSSNTFSFFKLQFLAPDLEKLIKERFQSYICEKADIPLMISKFPIELAYCLALINTKSRYSITPPWVVKNFPEVERVMFLLRSNPCMDGCKYCNSALDIYKALNSFFGYNTYRTYGGEALQEKAVKAAVDNKSLLAVFPTGGGKSITFQIPALMSGVNTKGLTVVISPLQSLMKDQVDNLERASITEAVAINGLLDPIERAKAIERVGIHSIYFAGITAF